MHWLIDNLIMIENCLSFIILYHRSLELLNTYMILYFWLSDLIFLYIFVACSSFHLVLMVNEINFSYTNNSIFVNKSNSNFYISLYARLIRMQIRKSVKQ
jgi:hypothetical protein